MEMPQADNNAAVNACVCSRNVLSVARVVGASSSGPYRKVWLPAFPGVGAVGTAPPLNTGRRFEPWRGRWRSEGW
eukprot:8117870-Pyramimonas_sp.AAC.1